jgi:hypothetical protein
MDSKKNGITRRKPKPSNAFTRSFLRRLGERDEPPAAGEADVAGPWRIVPIPGHGFGLLREGESLARGYSSPCSPPPYCPEPAGTRCSGSPRSRTRTDFILSRWTTGKWPASSRSSTSTSSTG